MKTYIFDNLDELNKFIENKNHKKVDIQWHSSVVSQRKDKDEIIYEIVDRWMVIVK